MEYTRSKKVIRISLFVVTLLAQTTMAINIEHSTTFSDGEFYAITDNDKSEKSLYRQSKDYLKGGDPINTQISIDLKSLHAIESGNSDHQGQWTTYRARGTYFVQFGNTQFERATNLAIKLTNLSDFKSGKSRFKLYIYQRDFSRSDAYANTDYLIGGVLDTDLKFADATTSSKSKINPLATSICIQMHGTHSNHLDLTTHDGLESVVRGAVKTIVDVKIVLANSERSESVICLNQAAESGEFDISYSGSSTMPSRQSIASAIDLTRF